MHLNNLSSKCLFTFYFTLLCFIKDECAVGFALSSEQREIEVMACNKDEFKFANESSQGFILVMVRESICCGADELTNINQPSTCRTHEYAEHTTALCWMVSQLPIINTTINHWDGELDESLV
jgi:hypothetical protein